MKKVSCLARAILWDSYFHSYISTWGISQDRQLPHITLMVNCGAPQYSHGVHSSHPFLHCHMSIDVCN
ncbi:MAG: hypothetical protein Q8O41_03995 [Candidatus Methanoperedens sp.]|nr:hypothetical protein [Candidatus Methanoperedens sp.]